jgi:hypothetical protein
MKGDYYARKERDTPEGITRVGSRDREVWLGDCLCTGYRVQVTEESNLRRG